MLSKRRLKGFPNFHACDGEDRDCRRPKCIRVRSERLRAVHQSRDRELNASLIEWLV